MSLLLLLQGGTFYKAMHLMRFPVDSTNSGLGFKMQRKAKLVGPRKAACRGRQPQGLGLPWGCAS